jgi:membrane protease YdiL (CAAX protease family)
MKILMNTEQRLRAGWRILLQCICFVILLIIVQVIQKGAQEQPDLLIFTAVSGLYLFGGLGMCWVLGRWVDRRKFADFGFHLDREWWLDLGFGLFLGAFILTAVFIIEWGAGWVKVTSIAQTVFDGPFILVGCCVLLSLTAVGVIEELMFRGYQLRNLAEGINYKGKADLAVIAALVGTSIFFGIAHMGNQNATLMSGVNVTLAGMLLGLGYVLTGELALPIGLHISWGFFEEFVYGFANSGEKALSWLIGSEVAGPEIWTGGEFGPEAGLLVTILIVLEAVMIFFWVKFRGRFRGVRRELAEYVKR